jgi:hypothetical protein
VMLRARALHGLPKCWNIGSCTYVAARALQEWLYDK